MKKLIQISQRNLASVFFIAITISGIFLVFLIIKPNYDDHEISINIDNKSEEQLRDLRVLNVTNIHGKESFKDSSGNIYIAGYFLGSIDLDVSDNKFEIISNDFDIFLAKYDPYGRFIWGKHIGGPGKDAIHAMKVDKSGNVVLVVYRE